MTTQRILSNRYRIIRKLGDGGFGETFLGEDSLTPAKRPCVIKQLKPVDSEPKVAQLVRERFQREAAILEELGDGCNQIPKLYAYLSEGGHFYLVQEWVEGKTLSDKVATEGPLGEDEVREMLASLLPVLDYVHSKRIVHRDIKPDNIIWRQSDCQPVLIDFGAVKEAMGTVASPSGNKVTNSIVIGTPGFMPPEQGIGRPVYASDLYSLGLTAIYLLTGKPPQQLGTDPGSGEIVWHQHAPQVASSLVAVLDKAIMSHPRDRYSSAKEMLYALESGNYKKTTLTEATANFTPTQTPSRSQRLPISTILLGIFGASAIASAIGSAISRQPVYSPTVPSDPKRFAGSQAPVPSPRKPDTKLSPEQAVRSQYSVINNRQYETAWKNLSPGFQNNKVIFPDGYMTYVNWWETVDWVEVEEAIALETTATTATVRVRLTYSMKNELGSSESRRIDLVRDVSSGNWLLDSTTSLD
ncbi:MAG: serine/threonine protein kinase [Oscillatoria sp. SIO1A7]|nr:serine/threonine protein kinase [Oscillatoria sp. SIO1A7]